MEHRPHGHRWSALVRERPSRGACWWACLRGLDTHTCVKDAGWCWIETIQTTGEGRMSLGHSQCLQSPARQRLFPIREWQHQRVAIGSPSGHSCDSLVGDNPISGIHVCHTRRNAVFDIPFWATCVTHVLTFLVVLVCLRSRFVVCCWFACDASRRLGTANVSYTSSRT